jgi:hypothetical protein
MITADLNHRLDGVRAAQGSSEGGWHAEAADGQGLGQPFAQGRGGAGVGAVQLTGQRLRLCLGHQRIGMVVGGPHPLGHHRGHCIGEPVADVAELSGEGLARWRLLRFQPLPIQPCVKFSLTRLTDTVHRVACADAYRTVPASR